MAAYLQNKNLKWTSAPGATASAVNAVLLSAAKSLLQSIYTLSPNSADYLPWSYTHFNPSLTKYVIHSAADTCVRWPAVKNQQITWRSEPGTTPRGWSGTVTQSGLADVAASVSTPASCCTDCSGFITSLFTYVNLQQVTTTFTAWKSGQANTIPEAGCFDPGPGSGACQRPSSENYYKYFSTSTNGFQRVELGDIQPGDLLAWANTADETDSGHIMLIVAVADGAAGGGKYAVVADESSNHTDDSRGSTPGLGLGTIRLALDNNVLQFYWGADSKNPQTGPAAIGRAHGARAP